MTEDVELVWGIPRSVMESEIGQFQGFLRQSQDLMQLCQNLEPLGSFRERPQAEEDSSWKQVIPYVSILHGNQILVLQRLKTQGEKRLHGKRSIGVGGHINPESEGAEPLMIRGLRRELLEEIGLSPELTECQFLGWINDDETAVGQVHLGLAVTVKVAEKPEIVETDRMTGEWLALEDLDPDSQSWESWSSLLISQLLLDQVSS
ncbi:MAG: hypothetical protein CBC13_12160 [Planctomycetia bacterium TMED53]|nr:MAG: hypothetical protein CBC13_12160 [Planctomycetia bacterium TMED53]